MSTEHKAYKWSGVIKSDLKVEVGPEFGGPGELTNLSIQKQNTYRDDIDGVRYAIYCDNGFEVRIVHKGKLLMILQGEEVRKYWCSTVDEAVERCKDLLSENIPAYYIYKRAENYYLFYMSELKLSDHRLVRTVSWQSDNKEVSNEISD
ncbi:hypothetical protein [Sporomusa sp.]|uniref:hypothetical protein n=1 Tax=Sporomusa sp. TaxID=2078658 RepID=UPI002B559B18|nr:hypothetical protein [Sporomusa sp.]HWR07788.1 hypothetical protein [Sporomusa sp.]